MQLAKNSKVQILVVGIFAAGALFTGVAVADDAHAAAHGVAHSVMTADLSGGDLVSATVNGTGDTDGVDPWS